MALLVKSLAVLRAEVHRLRVATLQTLGAELAKRNSENARIRELLAANPLWRAAAGELQQRCLSSPVSTEGRKELVDWAEQLCSGVAMDTPLLAGAPSEEALRAAEELLAGLTAVATERLEDVHVERFAATPGRSFATWQQPHCSAFLAATALTAGRGLPCSGQWLRVTTWPLPRRHLRGTSSLRPHDPRIRKRRGPTLTGLRLRGSGFPRAIGLQPSLQKQYSWAAPVPC